MLKFYTTPQLPPVQASGYREPYGIRPVVDFERELDQMAQQCRAAADSRVQEAALTIIAQVRHRAYTAFQDFRHDLTAYLEAVHSMHQTLPNLTEARQAWTEALYWLRSGIGSAIAFLQKPTSPASHGNETNPLTRRMLGITYAHEHCSHTARQ